MDIALIFFLILCNGIFAMSEIAVVSARKTRLQRLMEEGRADAAAALALHNEPSTFLSTVQVGITTIGILSGAIGENALAMPMREWLREFPAIAPYADGLAFALVIAFITFLSVVVGELVPKRLALLAPETIAMLIARPMTWLSVIARPIVFALSWSSSAILKLLRASRPDEPPVTNEEIKTLMEQGAEFGVFHASEQAIVSNVLRLDEQRIGAIMTPRKDIVWIDLEDDRDAIRAAVLESPYSRIVVCRHGLENIEGILQISDLTKQLLTDQPISLESVLRTPLYVPETITTTQMLESFRRARLHFGLIVDEYGDLQGLVTLTDVLTAIVGDLPNDSEAAAADAVRREDGTWLIDGAMTLERFGQLMNIDRFENDRGDDFHTMGGFAMHYLGRIPAVADRFERGGFTFEIVDMDRNRVDKMLVTPPPEEPEL
ncbi:hemolysin family protein [Imbroritus primus]|uniref:hemolysin family protein n=1 Tax=Imbroritus primus TaxID=3058603 RepID=UPI003D1610A6